MENSAQWKKLLFAAQSGTGFIFYLLRRHAMNHSFDLKIYLFTPPGYMRRTWHWTEAGYNETNLLYHTTNCIFRNIEIYHMKSNPQDLPNPISHWKISTQSMFLIKRVKSFNTSQASIWQGWAVREDTQFQNTQTYLFLASLWPRISSKMAKWETPSKESKCACCLVESPSC